MPAGPPPILGGAPPSGSLGRAVPVQRARSLPPVTVPPRRAGRRCRRRRQAEPPKRRHLKSVALGVMIPLRMRASRRRFSQDERFFLPEVTPRRERAAPRAPPAAPPRPPNLRNSSARYCRTCPGWPAPLRAGWGARPGLGLGGCAAMRAQA